MKKYIKKFNTELEYECWLETQFNSTETKIGVLSSSESNLSWFLASKDIYIAVDDATYKNSNFVEIYFENEEGLIFYSVPISALDRFNNCIVIPWTLIKNLLLVPEIEDIEMAIVLANYAEEMPQ